MKKEVGTHVTERLFNFRLIFASVLQCVRKKWDQNAICNISYKTRAILLKFGTPLSANISTIFICRGARKHRRLLWLHFRHLSSSCYFKLYFATVVLINTLLPWYYRCVRWAFHVSQGSVETLSRWGGNCLMVLQQIYSGNDAPNFSESPEFNRRYYKKHFGLIFSGHSVY